MGLGNHPLVRYTLRRLCAGLALVLVVSALVFAATQVLPGDAAQAILGRNAASPSALNALRLQLGLEKPVVEQYTHWLGGLLHGQLGRSYATQDSVASLIGDRIGNTLILAGCTLALLVPVSLILGTAAGIHRGRAVDKIVSTVTLGAIALPEFVTGTVFVLLFAVTWAALPAVSLIPPGASPLTEPSALVLPVATLLVSGLAYNIRMVRAGVAEVMEADYVEAARLNGIPERRIVRRHVLANALPPSVQTFSMTVQYLVGGVVVVETLFQYPGIGAALVQAVATRDIPVVQALSILIAVLYIVINIAADLAVVLLIPTLRTEAG